MSAPRGIRREAGSIARMASTAIIDRKPPMAGPEIDNALIAALPVEKRSAATITCPRGPIQRLGPDSVGPRHAQSPSRTLWISRRPCQMR
jgi:hypothetical protein